MNHCTRLSRWLLLSLLLGISGPGSAAQVVMAFGEKIPPFCFPESDSGIELDVIGEALAFRGHKLEPRYFPLARVPLAFRRGEVDAAMTDLGQDLGAAGAHYGNPAVIYDNVFISLNSRHLEINTPKDLKGLSVVAFPGAARRYPEWLAATQKAGLYFEQNNQELQVLGLNKGRFDLVLSDKSIYRYFELLLERTNLFKAKTVDLHPFTEEAPQNYRPLFRDRQIRDDFNAGLEQLKASGRYQAIYDHYLKQ
ncbi:substrate-binding periplasmic protein [Pseudomonas paeninsulae]|uniref:substrate-binding periplasmic protein n=1 Tax=Pseudomonas paeninsulae TaxID=3110772 RepID=UPI002D7A0820|nr:ABC transporter substrate-binding protein [Pseudomonas sp. IT1137]